MTPLKAGMATLLKRRFALAAAIVATTGAAAGVAVAAAHTTAPAPAQLAASSGPSPSASPRAGAHADRRHPLITALVAATAKETGLSVETIRSDLQSGQTLDQIAGRKAGDVENDVLSALKTRLDKVVDRGRITKDQEQDLLSKAKTRIEKLMSTPLKQKAAGTTQAAG